MTKLLLTTTFCLGLMSSAAFADDYCVKQYSASTAATQAQYSPQIEAVYAEIKKVQDAGLDPARYLVPFDGELVTLYQKANNIVVRYRGAMAEASGEQKGCAAVVAPANIVVNGGIKAYAIWATYGLALLLPDRMTNVDVGEILHGKPLGGENAAIPKLREALLGGDRGTIANIIRDPIRCSLFLRKC
jgi:hypothetical protein